MAIKNITYKAQQSAQYFLLSIYPYCVRGQTETDVLSLLSTLVLSPIYNAQTTEPVTVDNSQVQQCIQIIDSIVQAQEIKSNNVNQNSSSELFKGEENSFNSYQNVQVTSQDDRSGPFIGVWIPQASTKVKSLVDIELKYNANVDKTNLDASADQQFKSTKRSSLYQTKNLLNWWRSRQNKSADKEKDPVIKLEKPIQKFQKDSQLFKMFVQQRTRELQAKNQIFNKININQKSQLKISALESLTLKDTKVPQKKNFMQNLNNNELVFQGDMIEVSSKSKMQCNNPQKNLLDHINLKASQKPQMQQIKDLSNIDEITSQEVSVSQDEIENKDLGEDKEQEDFSLASRVQQQINKYQQIGDSSQNLDKLLRSPGSFMNLVDPKSARKSSSNSLKSPQFKGSSCKINEFNKKISNKQLYLPLNVRRARKYVNSTKNLNKVTQNLSRGSSINSSPVEDGIKKALQNIKFGSIVPSRKSQSCRMLIEGIVNSNIKNSMQKIFQISSPQQNQKSRRNSCKQNHQQLKGIQKALNEQLELNQQQKHILDKIDQVGKLILDQHKIKNKQFPKKKVSFSAQQENKGLEVLLNLQEMQRNPFTDIQSPLSPLKSGNEEFNQNILQENQENTYNQKDLYLKMQNFAKQESGSSQDGYIKKFTFGGLQKNQSNQYPMDQIIESKEDEQIKVEQLQTLKQNGNKDCIRRSKTINCQVSQSSEESSQTLQSLSSQNSKQHNIIDDEVIKNGKPPHKNEQKQKKTYLYQNKNLIKKQNNYSDLKQRFKSKRDIYKDDIIKDNEIIEPFSGKLISSQRQLVTQQSLSPIVKGKSQKNIFSGINRRQNPSHSSQIKIRSLVNQCEEEEKSIDSGFQGLKKIRTQFLQVNPDDHQSVKKLMRQSSMSVNHMHQWYQDRIDQKQAALAHFRNKSKQLQKNLENTKLFLNMVIHDLRSPTTQVEFLVSQLLIKLKNIKDQYMGLKAIRPQSHSIPRDAVQNRQNSGQIISGALGIDSIENNEVVRDLRNSGSNVVHSSISDSLSSNNQSFSIQNQDENNQIISSSNAQEEAKIQQSIDDQLYMSHDKICIHQNGSNQLEVQEEEKEQQVINQPADQIMDGSPLSQNQIRSSVLAQNLNIQRQSVNRGGVQIQSGSFGTFGPLNQQNQRHQSIQFQSMEQSFIHSQQNNSQNQNQNNEMQINSNAQQQAQIEVQINQNQIFQNGGEEQKQDLNENMYQSLQNNQNSQVHEYALEVVNELYMKLNGINQQKKEFFRKLRDPQENSIPLINDGGNKELIIQRPLVKQSERLQDLLRDSVDEFCRKCERSKEPRINKRLARKLHLSFNQSLDQDNIVRGFDSIPNVEQIDDQQQNDQHRRYVQQQQINQQIQNPLQIDSSVRPSILFNGQYLLDQNVQQCIVQNISQSQIQIMPDKDNLNLQELLLNDIFEEGKQLDQVIDSIQNCGYQATTLLNLINDLLDFAKLEKMQFQLNKEFFDLTKTIKITFETLQYFQTKKNIKPKLVIDPEFEHFFKNVYGDENRVTQILLNFLSNAFKMTKSGGNITVEVKAQDGDNQEAFSKLPEASIDQIYNNANIEKQIQRQKSQQVGNKNNSRKVPSSKKQSSQKLIPKEFNKDNLQNLYFISFQIRITDTGPGIAPDDIQKLFINFSKLADHSGANKQGTGLGLSICKHIIEQMGGDVRVESEGLGHGATFIIELKAISKVKQYRSQGSKDCIVEELHNSFSLNSENENKKQQEIKEQKNALEIAQKGNNIRKILNDQKLLQRVKIFQNQEQNSFIASLLANSSLKDKELLNKIIQNQDQIENTLHLLRVLIVNDEEFILKMWEQMVKQVEITIIDTAQNGFDAFELVKKNQYDFILCDLNMPVMNGYTCATKIWAHYNQNELFQYNDDKRICPYLVACSALVTCDIEQKAKEHRFNIVLRSPLTINVLEESILVKVFDQIKYQMQHQINDINESSVIERVYFFDENNSLNDQISMSDSQLQSKSLESSSSSKNKIDTKQEDSSSLESIQSRSSKGQIPKSIIDDPNLSNHIKNIKQIGQSSNGSIVKEIRIKQQKKKSKKKSQIKNPIYIHRPKNNQILNEDDSIDNSKSQKEQIYELVSQFSSGFSNISDQKSISDVDLRSKKSGHSQSRILQQICSKSFKEDIVNNQNVKSGAHSNLSLKSHSLKQSENQEDAIEDKTPIFGQNKKKVSSSQLSLCKQSKRNNK